MSKIHVELPPMPHAKLSASGAERWTNCPGCIQASEGLPNETSRVAALGTVAHHVASECLEHGYNTSYFRGKGFSADGHLFTVDAEMEEAVNVYLNTIYNDIRDGDGQHEMLVEANLTPALRLLHPDFGGISDCIVVFRYKGLVRVYDYKHGEGLWVDVFNNKQLMYYALGVLLSVDNPEGLHTVELVVVQPRYGQEDHIRRFQFDAIDLLEYEVDLVEAAKETEMAFPRLNPGDWCRWCPARKVPCAALEEAEARVLSSDFEELPVEGTGGSKLVASVTPEKVGEAWPLIEALEHRIRAIRKLAYEYQMKGIPVPNTKLVAKRATRKWKDQEKAEKLFGIQSDAWTEPQFKSVAQVEKLVGKKHFAKVVDTEDLVSKESSGYKVVSADAPGKPADPKLITADDFEDLD